MGPSKKAGSLIGGTGVERFPDEGKYESTRSNRQKDELHFGITGKL